MSPQTWGLHRFRRDLRVNSCQGSRSAMTSRSRGSRGGTFGKCDVNDVQAAFTVSFDEKTGAVAHRKTESQPKV